MFGMQRMVHSDFSRIRDYVGTLAQARPVRFTEQERVLILSGQHPNVALFRHSLTGVPIIRVTEGVSKGTILGQVATRVSLAADAEPSDLSLAGYRCRCFAMVEELLTTLPTYEAEQLNELTCLSERQLGHVEVVRRAGRPQKMVCEGRTCQHKDDFFKPNELMDHLLTIRLSAEEEEEGRVSCVWGDCKETLESELAARQHLLHDHARLSFRCSNCGSRFESTVYVEVLAHCANCRAGGGGGGGGNDVYTPQSVWPVSIRFELGSH